MGYTTEFSGEFRFDKDIDPALAKYLNDFAKTRHMRLNVDEVKKDDPEWAKHCFNGEMGFEGQFYVNLNENLNRAEMVEHPTYGHKYYKFCDDLFYNDNQYVIDNNTPAEGVPSLWCQWVVDEEENVLVWDGGEKFYHYIEWLKYLITNFIEPSGYKLNGKVRWRGEDFDDMGAIVVQDNKVKVEN